MRNLDLKTALLLIPIMLLSFSIHEACHGFMAYFLGDDTAKNQGRLTLNPIRHIDPAGFIMLFLFGFGWAKPVPYNPANFKNKKWGSVLTALAGPLSNLLLGFAFALMLSGLFVGKNMLQPEFTNFEEILYTLFGLGVSVNVSLAIFNLIPIPPLDGSKIVFGFLPSKWYFKMLEYERVIYMITLLLIFTGVLSKIISPIIDLIIGCMLNLSFIVVAFFYHFFMDGGTP